ncbi:aminotransferase class I/II-fold pyridoxal phosphate-dependent enzyme [Clostridiaceae bacterium M8S5]|nr:aminotransferase class I/II-fold pyridoxal phosphate-dependent enzyme [Clostridiaceae bacterium M8S5]
MGLIANITSDRLKAKQFAKYKFAEIKQLKKDLLLKNTAIDILNFGIGEPDSEANSGVIDTLCNEACKKENRGYADNGIQSFKNSCSSYMKHIYGIDIDPSNEVLHGIGIKSILSMLPLCFINPGDYSLVTVPGYPIIASHTKYLGGRVFNLPLYDYNNFYPNLNAVPEDILNKTKILYINYPNNPTGQIPDFKLYSKIVALAHKYKFVVVSDAAYGPLVYDGVKPLSFLSIDGAKEIGVEVHSLSKAFNMTGWRLAFIAGNSDIINLYSIVKNSVDSGQFIPIQKAGIYALGHTEITQNTCSKYSRRLDMLVDVLKEIGFDVNKPRSTFYLYTKIPKGTKSGVIFESAMHAFKYILENAFVSTVPWDDAGHFLRFSVTYDADSIKEEKKVMALLKERLQGLELVF